MNSRQIAIRAYTDMLSRYCEHEDPRQAFVGACRTLRILCEQHEVEARVMSNASVLFTGLCRDHDIIGVTPVMDSYAYRGR